ncbi:MAG TPA: hypothetical protein VFE78_06960 [Gemmataceae bacterium]|jgi:hypothetical protein|nr:hypothetical protein [Gemmataceae bacterium]
MSAPAARRPRRWVGFFLLLAVVAAAAGVTPVIYNLRLQLTPEQAAQARERWRERGPRDYDLRCTEKLLRGGAEERNEYVVLVRGGRAVALGVNGELLRLEGAGPALGPVVRALPGDADAPAGVGPLFDRIETALRQDAAEGRRTYATATFDPHDGHPVRYVRRVRATGERVEWNCTLARPGELKPDLPARPSALPR